MEPFCENRKRQESAMGALLDNRIDVIATDHAPHTLEEKQQPYSKAPSESISATCSRSNV
jgi:dihydroorotase